VAKEPGYRNLYELGWAAGIRFPVAAREFFLLHSMQTGCGAHSASYPTVGTSDFPRGKAVDV
jgi:hypothetical protein